MAATKKLALANGVFSRDGKPDETAALTTDQMIERAAACLEEAARCQSPRDLAYTHQAEVWLAMAAAVKPK